MMRVVIVGSGGREHALADVCHRQGHQVVVSPGNAGIPWSTPFLPTELEADLFVIGPEQPLVDGLADELRAQGKLVFGPGVEGAQIEGSKAFMKELVRSSGAPTASFSVIRDVQLLNEILPRFFRDGREGCAVKTDGLAAGKGVTICTSYDAAYKDARAKLTGSFGGAGETVVVEELLGKADLSDCYERSVFVLVSVTKNGIQRQLIPVMAQDYKRVSSDPTSPMTGGMGCWAPTGDEDKLEQWAQICIDPVLAEMQKRGIDYIGFMYFGLMIVGGMPFVLEINVRFGDPEAEVLLPLVVSDLAYAMYAAAKGEKIPEVQCSDDFAVTVVLAAEGYPDSPVKGDVIRGLSKVLESNMAGISIFAAGVAASDVDGVLLTNGGRVLEVTATSHAGYHARHAAYTVVSMISFKTAAIGRTDDTKVYRDDIAAQWS